MPDRPDYAALTRGQIALLDRINAGETGLAVLNQLVRLAQDVLGGCGAGFAEYSPGHGRIIAASGLCTPALGRRVDRDDTRPGSRGRPDPDGPAADTGPATASARDTGPATANAGDTDPAAVNTGGVGSAAANAGGVGSAAVSGTGSAAVSGTGSAAVSGGTGPAAVSGTGSAAVSGGTGPAAVSGTGSAAVSGGTGPAAVSGTGSAAVSGGTGPAAVSGGGSHTRLIPLDALNGAFVSQIEGGDLHRMLGARCEIGGLIVGSLHVYHGEEAGEPTEEHHAVLELLAANIGHMYGDQAGLPVHGDGPVVAALADGLAIVDRDGIVQLWNPAAEQITGRSVADALQRELPFPAPPPGQVLVHRLPSGRWLKVTAGDLPRTPAMRVVTFRDSTDQDRRHEDRDLFVAVTSHELRTPVTVIKGYADTLTNHWGSMAEAERQEAVRVIGARAGELARLVDRLLSATSDDGEVGGSPPGPFDLVEGLRAAAAELPADLRRRLVLERLPGELPKAFGDRDSLATILTELATNADKYSPPDTEVEVSAEADEATVTFRVADRGVGVKAEHVERAFERYWQGESPDKGRNPGAGLGLYLVRRIVERQQGWVSLRPRDGGGTVAEVRLPRG